MKSSVCVEQPVVKHRGRRVRKKLHSLGSLLRNIHRKKDDIVLEYYEACVYRGDVEALEDKRWLNDNNITFWFEYLEHGIGKDLNILLLKPALSFLLTNYSGDLQFLVDALPTSKIASSRLVFLPVNDNVEFGIAGGGSHWALLVADIVTSTAYFYDSMGDSNLCFAKKVSQKLALLLHYYKHNNKSKIVANSDENEETNNIVDSGNTTNTLQNEITTTTVITRTLIPNSTISDAISIPTIPHSSSTKVLNTFLSQNLSSTSSLAPLSRSNTDSHTITSTSALSKSTTTPLSRSNTISHPSDIQNGILTHNYHTDEDIDDNSQLPILSPSSLSSSMEISLISTPKSFCSIDKNPTLKADINQHLTLNPYKQFKFISAGTPQQQNGTDCGIVLCMVVEVLIERLASQIKPTISSSADLSSCDSNLKASSTSSTSSTSSNSSSVSSNSCSTATSNSNSTSPSFSPSIADSTASPPLDSITKSESDISDKKEMPLPKLKNCPTISISTDIDSILQIDDPFSSISYDMSKLTFDAGAEREKMLSIISILIKKANMKKKKSRSKHHL